MVRSTVRAARESQRSRHGRRRADHVDLMTEELAGRLKDAAITKKSRMAEATTMIVISSRT